MQIKDIKLNPNNPRFIKDDKFKKLCQSIKDDPEFLDARPIIIKDGIVFGGNMRFRALKELGMDIKEEWIKDVSNWTDEQIRKFIVVDNIAYGDNDWDLLSEQYEREELEDWGMDVDKWNDIDFDNIKSNEDRETSDKKQKVTCPKCGELFEV
jgi:ParB-like chromosome segregation protein Spo0J